MSKRKPNKLAHHWSEHDDKIWGSLISYARPANPIGTYARDGGKYYGGCYGRGGKTILSGPMATPEEAKRWVETHSGARLSKRR